MRRSKGGSKGASQGRGTGGVGCGDGAPCCKEGDGGDELEVVGPLRPLLMAEPTTAPCDRGRAAVSGSLRRSLELRPEKGSIKNERVLQSHTEPLVTNQESIVTNQEESNATRRRTRNGSKLRDNATFHSPERVV